MNKNELKKITVQFIEVKNNFNDSYGHPWKKLSEFGLAWTVIDIDDNWIILLTVDSWKTKMLVASFLTKKKTVLKPTGWLLLLCMKFGSVCWLVFMFIETLKLVDWKKFSFHRLFQKRFFIVTQKRPCESTNLSLVIHYILCCGAASRKSIRPMGECLTLYFCRCTVLADDGIFIDFGFLFFFNSSSNAFVYIPRLTIGIHANLFRLCQKLHFSFAQLFCVRWVSPATSCTSCVSFWNMQVSAFH